jgi:hypothetical protein
MSDRDYTRFDVPVRRDSDGWITTEPFLVQNRLIPAMASIIRAATQPVLLRQQLTINARDFDCCTAEDVLAQWRLRVAHNLEDQMRAEAKKSRVAIITDLSFEESLADRAVLFTMSAVGMPLVDRIEL